ncbi:MAG: tetratricopeptide repeat protein [Syntrophales bacterium]|nr:tetratricopeptide repeat protein [Syntrophales bacterium]
MNTRSHYVKVPASSDSDSQIIGYSTEKLGSKDKETSTDVQGISFGMVSASSADNDQEDNLLKLKSLTDPSKLQGMERKEALKKLADTHFELGKRVSHHHLFQAVQIYKQLLKEYPDPQEGNDAIYHNLAISYEGLNFFHEAIASWEKLINGYSSSPLKINALIHIAHDFYRVGRYEKAVEAYRNFINTHQKSNEEKTAWLGLAASYFKLNKYQHAHEAYETIANKWPPFIDVSKEHLFQAGVSAHMCNNHRVALRLLMAFASLHPNDPLTSKALLISARSLLSINKTKAALHILSLILERFPQSEEAWESIHTAALIGIRERDQKIPYHLAAAQYFYDPIHSYDLLLNTTPKPPKEKEDLLLLEKADGLRKMGYEIESLKTCLLLLDKKPEGSIRTDTLIKAAGLSTSLIDRFYAEGDTLAVLYIYYMSASRGVFGPENPQTLLKVAQSLEKLALHGESKKILDFIKYTSTNRNVIREVEDIYSRLSKSEKVSPLIPVVASLENKTTPDPDEISKAINSADEESKRWLLYALARIFMKENDQKKVAEITEKIKEGTPQTFWIKLADYTLVTMHRMKKHPDLYRK